jgi:hypothetical protein
MKKNTIYRAINAILAGAMLCGVAMLGLGCGEDGASKDKSRVHQPVEEAKGAVRLVVPAGWKIVEFSVASFERGPEDDTLVSTFRAEITPDETLGLIVANVEGTNILREVIGAGERVTVVGKISAKRYADIWQVKAKLESEVPWLAGATKAIQPVSTFTPFVLEGSPEEAELRGRREIRQREELERQQQAEIAHAEAESKVRMAKELTDAEERMQRQRIAAQEQAERERLEREQTLAAMRQRLEAVRNEYGLLLMLGDLEEHWGAVLCVKEVDEEHFTFSGEGVNYASLPPAAVKFSGEVREDKSLIVTFQHRSEPLVFDQFHATGNFSSEAIPGSSLRRMGAHQREQFDQRAEKINGLMDAPQPGVMSNLHRRHEALRDFPPLGGEMRVNNQPGIGGKALTWIDGRVDTGWVAKKCTVVLRYRQVQKAHGMVLVCGKLSFGESMTGGALIINGRTRIVLPHVRGRYDSDPRIIEFVFDSPLEVYELRFEAPSAHMVINEIVLLRTPA